MSATVEAEVLATIATTKEKKKKLQVKSHADEAEDDDDDENEFIMTYEGSVINQSNKNRQPTRSSRPVNYTDISDDAMNATLHEEQHDSNQKKTKKRRMV